MVLLITQILETSIPLKGERAERLFTPAPAAQLLKALRYPLDLWQSTAGCYLSCQKIMLPRCVRRSVNI